MRTRKKRLPGQRITRCMDRKLSVLEHDERAGSTGERQKVRLKRSAGPNHESSCVACKESELSLVAQTVKKLPAMQDTHVRSLGQKDPLENGMATHSSILAWRILWTEQPSWLQSTGLQRFRHD